MMGDGGGHIDKAATAKAGSATARHHNRHTFAGMFGAGPGGIIAVIGGEQRHITRLQPRQKAAHAGIEPFQRAGIARHVAPVAIEAVEFDKVRKGQGTRLCHIQQMVQMIEKCSVILALVQL